MDFEVQRCTRHCAASGRELRTGEIFFSALASEGATVTRHDYSSEAWTGPPEGALGWWKSQMPALESKSRKTQWAPNDVMLQLFDELADQPQRADMRYVLTLLLVRAARAAAGRHGTDRLKAGNDATVLPAPPDRVPRGGGDARRRASGSNPTGTSRPAAQQRRLIRA